MESQNFQKNSGNLIISPIFVLRKYADYILDEPSDFTKKHHCANQNHLKNELSSLLAAFKLGSFESFENAVFIGLHDISNHDNFPVLMKDIYGQDIGNPCKEDYQLMFRQFLMLWIELVNLRQISKRFSKPPKNSPVHEFISFVSITSMSDLLKQLSYLELILCYFISPKGNIFTISELIDSFDYPDNELTSLNILNELEQW